MPPAIWVVPFFGQGHLFPCMELCKQLASRHFRPFLIISSDFSSSLTQHPFFQILQVPSSHPSPAEPGVSDPLQHHRKYHADIAQGIQKLLSNILDESNRPVCAVTDAHMGWTSDIFMKYDIPTIAFFTAGACSQALGYAMWKAYPLDVKQGEIRLLPGLPQEITIKDFDLKRRPPGGGGPTGKPMGFPSGAGPRRMGPPRPDCPPFWMEQVKDAVAFIINTCDDLERPFIQYLETHMGKPVWGVGPLLPEQFWASTGSLLRDRDVRSNRRSNFTEDEVIEWLESKPQGSVLYVSFGSEVSPTTDELAALADSLESSSRPFIWVIQPSSNTEKAEGLRAKVGERGMIIRGWAPQLLILSHKSTGGFLSHCGWNSTVEAIGHGVPLLAWPIRGDQFNNAKLITSYLKVGCVVCDDLSEMVDKDDITKGIERVMREEEFKKQSAALRAKFSHGFPPSSLASLDAFGEFIYHKKH